MFRIEQRDAANPPPEILEGSIKLLVSDCPVLPTSKILDILMAWAPLVRSDGRITVLHNKGMAISPTSQLVEREAGLEFLKYFTEREIIFFTEKNDLVVDPFCGQYNITGKLCLLHNRSFFGCDLYPLEMLDGTPTPGR